MGLTMDQVKVKLTNQNKVIVKAVIPVVGYFNLPMG